jgi:hypothetical protein
MRRPSRRTRVALFAALTVLLVGLLFIGSSIGYATLVSQWRLIIDSPNGISEAMYVSIGGIDQWIQIRGRDRAELRPVSARADDPQPGALPA